MNPNAQGFQPFRLHYDSSITASPEALRRSSSSLSNASFASQITLPTSMSCNPHASTVSDIRPSDALLPPRDARGIARHNLTTDTDIARSSFSAFDRQPGAIPNFSLAPVQAPSTQSHLLDQFLLPRRDDTSTSHAASTSTSSSTPRGELSASGYAVLRRGSSQSTSRSSSWCGSSLNLSTTNVNNTRTNYASSFLTTPSRQASDASMLESWAVVHPDRHDSVQQERDAHEQKAESIARFIMMGGTAPPDDQVFDHHARYDTKSLTEAANMPAGRFKNSKMFGPSSVSKRVLEQAQSAPALLQHPLADRASSPSWFPAMLRNGYMPTLDQVMADLPSEESCRFAIPAFETSVLKISDIPYTTSRQEMIAFVGQHAQISRMPAGSPYYAVHIIMERETGKTMDCFIELSNTREAAWVAKTMQNRASAGRPPKVNDRLVQVSVSSQEELMRELFPRAKHVAWMGSQPIVDTTPRQYYPGMTAAGFQGFMHSEEYGHMIKIAEMGERALFAKTLSRVYETMITILHKYPWHAVEHVSLAERRALYDAAAHILHCLMFTIESGVRGRSQNGSDTHHDSAPPTVALLAELAVAILGCPGFNEKQKSAIVAKLKNSGYDELAKSNASIKLGGSESYSSTWPFAVLAPVPGIEQDVIQFYLALLRTGTMRLGEDRALAYHVSSRLSGQHQPSGDFEIDYGRAPDALSMSEAACLEKQQIEHVCRAALRKDTPRRMPNIFL